MKYYTPRRSGKRWREGCPDFVLDVFDHPDSADRYTVILTGPNNIVPNTYTKTSVPYLAMSERPEHPQSIGLWCEMSAYDMARYRYSQGHRRIKWLDLPEAVRKHVEWRGA